MSLFRLVTQPWTQKEWKRNQTKYRWREIRFFYDFNQFSTLLATKKTTNESNPMNLKRYIDHYNISVNKILLLESVFGRRTIHLQGKEMTLISDGKMNNCDKDIFVIEEVTRTHSICSFLSAKNKAPILSKLSFIHPELIGTQKKRAFLLDLAFLHFKKKHRCGALSTAEGIVDKAPHRCFF